MQSNSRKESHSDGKESISSKPDTVTVECKKCNSAILITIERLANWRSGLRLCSNCYYGMKRG